MGSSARWPSPRFKRYQAQPNINTASATRSVTESKKAPRTEAVPAALATGPSKRSCMPVMIKKMMARWRWPDATRTAVAVADTRPVAVSTSAVMPWRWSVSPTGPVVRSTAVRQRPSNMKLLVVRVRGQSSGAVTPRAYHPAPETRRSAPPPPGHWRGRRPGRCRLRPWWRRCPATVGGVDQSRAGPARIPDCDRNAPSSQEDPHALHPLHRPPGHLRPLRRAGRRRSHRRRSVVTAAPAPPHRRPPRSRPSRPTSTSHCRRARSSRASTPSWHRTRGRRRTPS